MQVEYICGKKILLGQQQQNFKTMNYQLLRSNNPDVLYILVLENGNPVLTIPPDPANSDYQQYLKWLEEGNEPLPPDPIIEPEPPTPQQKLEAAGLSIEELKELLGL